MKTPELCWLLGVWRWLRTGLGVRVSGHDFVQQETHRGCTVIVSACACGHQAISWHHGEPSASEALSPVSPSCCRQCAEAREAELKFWIDDAVV